MAIAGKLPKNGKDGRDGRNGTDAEQPTIRVGKVELGSRTSVKNSGTKIDAVFDFVFEKPEDGRNGRDGSNGTDGRDGRDGRDAGGPEICTEVTIATNSNSYQEIANFTPAAGTVVRLSANLVSRKADGSHYSSFRRTALYGKQTILTRWGPDHSDHTLKTHPDFDVRFIDDGNTVRVQVKSPDADTAYWRGSVCTLEVSTV